MIRNYLTIAFRNIAKNRFFSILNVLGLSLGMTCCLSLILIIRDQLGYDNFHRDADRTFRILCADGGGMRIATTPYPIGDAILQDYAVASKTVRLIRGLHEADATTATKLSLPLTGYYTEPAFFEVFGFTLESGNLATALKDPTTLLLSKKMAERFFGLGNPIGQVLTIKDVGSFTVGGVVAEAPGKSHIVFDCLLPIAAQKNYEQRFTGVQAVERVTDNWENRFMTHAYVQLQPGKTQADLEQVLAAITTVRQNANPEEKNYHYFSQNLHKITPKPENYANEMGAGMPWFLIWGLFAFVVVLTLFPCLNYANMAIAQALTRAREVGVRKAIGASAGDVRRLIWAEAMLTAFLALGLSLLLQFPLNHFIAHFFPPQAELDALTPKPSDWLIFTGFSLVVGLLAGWLPARRFGKINALAALRSVKGGQKASRNRLDWRTLMMVGQFSLSLIFLIIVSVLSAQMRYMTLSNYGFQKENLLTVELQGNKANVVKQEFEQLPQVNGICMTSVVLASNNLQGIPLFKERGGEDLGIHCAMVDEQFIPVLGLEMAAGKNFSANAAQQKDEYLIINEKALERYQLGTPEEALGKTLWMDDSNPVAVLGVLKDFHYRIFDHAIEPFALRYSPTEKGYIMQLRLSPGDPQIALHALEACWKKIDAVHPFKAKFMDQSIQESYGHVTFIGGLLGFFGALALALACIGLLGMVTYSVNSRVKEIGIRKVLGASVSNVAFLLSRHYLILLLSAAMVAIPLGVFFSQKILEMFAFRISLSLTTPLLAVLLVALLSLSAIVVQAVRAALANPVESLRVNGE